MTPGGAIFLVAGPETMLSARVSEDELEDSSVGTTSSYSSSW